MIYLFKFVEYEGIRSLFAHFVRMISYVKKYCKTDFLKLYNKEKEKLL